MEFIKKAKWIYIFVSAVMIVFGIVMVLFPQLSMQTLCLLGGIVLLVFGAAKMLGYFSHDRFGLAFQFDFALGVFALLCGILMLTRAEKIILVLPAVLGVFILIDGAFKLQTALDARRFGLERWGWILVLAILTCICGAALLFDPFSGAIAIATLQGATLIVDGVQNLCVVAYTVRTI